MIARFGLLLLALAGGISCRSGGGAGDGAVAPGGRLVSSSALHDFGAVLDGDLLRHTFQVGNAGSAPVWIARIERSPACRPADTPRAPVAPGGTTTIEIECDPRNRPPKLADAILVFPEGGPPLRLELRATITPLLVFEPAMAALETLPDRSVTRIVRLVGAAAGRARPRVLDAGVVRGLEARVLPAGDSRGPGLELVLRARMVGDWSDEVLVSTGLDRPHELTLPYTARVKSAIEVEPIRPYFNLHTPEGRSRTLSVWSSRPGFRLLGAEIVSGPFRAAVESGKVRVSVDEARLPEGQRGVIGKLVILSNDKIEPRKEIQLFGLGAVAR